MSLTSIAARAYRSHPAAHRRAAGRKQQRAPAQASAQAHGPDALSTSSLRTLVPLATPCLVPSRAPDPRTGMVAASSALHRTDRSGRRRPQLACLPPRRMTAASALRRGRSRDGCRSRPSARVDRPVEGGSMTGPPQTCTSRSSSACAWRSAARTSCERSSAPRSGSRRPSASRSRSVRRSRSTPTARLRSREPSGRRTVRVAVATPNQLVNAAEQLAARVRRQIGAPLRGALVFDCAARMKLLERKFEVEARAVAGAGRSPTVGIASYGESRNSAAAWKAFATPPPSRRMGAIRTALSARQRGRLLQHHRRHRRTVSDQNCPCPLV